MITSLSNQKIKNVGKLRDSRFRRKENLFIIEGQREISLALEADLPIKELYFCKEFFRPGKEKGIVEVAQERKINLCEVNCKVYEKMAYGKRRGGLIAVARQPEYNLADIQLTANPFLIIAEGVEKPGNLGAILRTVDAADIDGLILVDSLTDVYNHQVVRSSLGTVFSKPVVATSSQELLGWLRKHRIVIICADPIGSVVYTSIDFKKSTALIVGNEEKGISNFWKEQAAIIASVPMGGKADSLNVSVTAAVFIFEALRQRQNAC